MPSVSRNRLEVGTWVLAKVEDRSICASFDCGHEDLNDYFHSKSLKHEQELLSQSYSLTDKAHPDYFIALLDFCNDGIHIDMYKHLVDLDEEKQYHHLPAVKLTRFGVRKELRNHDFGTHAMNLAKEMFTTDNRTGCRFLTVDSYPESVGFYEKNDFLRFPNRSKKKPAPDDNIALYFDLKRFTAQSVKATTSSIVHT
jgi:hypothetical protein